LLVLNIVFQPCSMVQGIVKKDIYVFVIYLHRLAGRIY